MPIQILSQRIPNERCCRKLVQDAWIRGPHRRHVVTGMTLMGIRAFECISVARHAIHLKRF